MPGPTPDYQKGFSEIAPRILDRAARELKARKMLAVLQAAGLLRGRGVAVDVGCSGGYFVAALAPHFDAAIGIDIDEPALRVAAREHAAARAAYVMADSQRFPFRDASVDLMVCNHVYEHVPDAATLLDEIWRALRPGAACYLGAASRLTPVEPHYRLPFLSWLPKFLADRYMRWTGRGERYYENLRTYWGIRALLRRFEVEDYTLRVVGDPDRFEARDLIPRGGWVDRVPKFIWRLFYWFLPSYILVLRKPAQAAAPQPHRGG